MNKLDELEKLADDFAEVGMVIPMHPNELKRLTALCRMQHEALGELVGATILVDEALAAYEQIMGEK